PREPSFATAAVATCALSFASFALKALLCSPLPHPHVFDHDAAVHHDMDSPSFGVRGGFGVEDALLYPEVLEVERQHFVDDGGDEPGQPEDIDDVGLYRQIGEGGEAFLPEHGLECGIYRKYPETVVLHVLGNIEAGFAGVVGEADDRHGRGGAFGAAQHVANHFWLIHPSIPLSLCPRGFDLQSDVD